MKTNVFGIVSLVCGIIGLCTVCIFFGILPAIVGIIMAIVGLCQKNTKYGTSIAGLICSIIAMCIFGIIFFFVNFSANEETEKETQSKVTSSAVIESTENNDTEQIVEDNLIDCEVVDCTVKYISHEVGYDRSDKKCLFVYYTFTNNNKEPKEFSYTIDDKAFQKGIELESSFWEVDGFENNKYAEIKPGAEITLVCVYQLRDNSHVELEIRKAYDFNNKVIDSMIIELE